MDRDFHGGAYGGSGHDGPHRRTYGRSQCPSQTTIVPNHYSRCIEAVNLTMLTILQDLSPITRLQWYNGCGIGDHNTRAERGWRSKGRVRAT